MADKTSGATPYSCPASSKQKDRAFEVEIKDRKAIIRTGVLRYFMERNI